MKNNIELHIKNTFRYIIERDLNNANLGVSVLIFADDSACLLCEKYNYIKVKKSKQFDYIYFIRFTFKGLYKRHTLDL